MTARLGAHLAEVRDERVDLAAVVRDERDDPRDPSDFGPLTSLEPLHEPGQQLVAGGRPRDEGVAQPGIARAELDQLPLLEVSQGGDDPAALLPERDGSLVGIEARPAAPGLAARHETPQEAGTPGIERCEHLLERAASRRRSERPEAVAGVERGSLTQQPSSSR